MSTPAAVVDDAGAIDAIAAAIAGAPLVAFDLEFLAQDRLVPRLCLVQVAWGHAGLDAATGAPGARAAIAPEVRLLDPLAVDVAPVIRAIAAHPCAVAHAPRQDLALLASRFGAEVPGVVDTQVMAAFAGLGDQIGLAALLGELWGVELGKDQQWTDWAARPLSAAQLAYAAADVAHLPATYRALAARLGPRLAWARAESQGIAEDALAAARLTPATAWRALGGLRGLDAASLAAAVALAGWRLAVCAELDRPLGQLVADKQLIELARARPARAGEVRAIRGLSGLARARADDIVRVIAEAPPAPIAPRPPARGPGPRAQRWAEVLIAITQLVAEEARIPPRLLATRADAEELARAVDEGGLAAAEGLAALTGWRRAVLGQAWLDWLTGARVLVGELGAPQGMRLIAR